MPRITQVEVVTFKGTMLKLGLFILIGFMLFLIVRCA